MSDTVKDWDLYLAGKKYNNALQPVSGYTYYELVDTLIDFFNGNQWRNMQNNSMRKPVFNIFQKAIRFFVASLTSTNIKANMEPLEFTKGLEDTEMTSADFATTEIANLLEKFKFDNRIRDALFKAGIMGDVASHQYWDQSKKPYGGSLGEARGEMQHELINGTNVFFGNANNPSTDVNIQPWIGISGRDMVDSLKAEAKLHKEDEDAIKEDTDYTNEAGHAAEIEIVADGYGKAQYFLIYRYDRETETVKASKCVQNAYIYEDIDTGLSGYPVAWLCWEKQESTYHGKAACTEILETQIYINLMFAMIYFSTAQTAFPKAVYNSQFIDEWSGDVGVAIGIDGVGAEVNVNNLAGYLSTGDMSNQLTDVIKMAYDYTKDILGINDAALGNVNPENASGKSIIAVVKQSGIPLENVKANEYEWIEDIVRISLDMMATYYGERPIVIEKDGNRSIQTFDFAKLKDVYLNIRIDVGETSIYSDIARKQTLDALFNNGQIEIIDYLERLDDTDIADRQGLIDKIKEQMAQQQAMLAQQQAQGIDPNNPQMDASMPTQEPQEAPPAEQEIPQEQLPQEPDQDAQIAQMMEFIHSLPDDVQQQIEDLPDDEAEQVVIGMMNEQGEQ